MGFGEWVSFLVMREFAISHFLDLNLCRAMEFSNSGPIPVALASLRNS